MQILTDKKGSMLVDILVGIGITSMMLTLSIPYINKFRTNLQLNGTAKVLAADIRYAQQMTVTEQSPYYVIFDTSANSYGVYKYDPATTTLKTVEFPQNIQFQQIDSNLNNMVVFNSFGAATESGNIALTNNNGKITTIKIKPSGYVQLEQ